MTFSVPELMHQGANTFEDRNKEYGDAYKRHGNIMSALYPNGITLITPDDFNQYLLFSHIIGKLNRYVSSKGGHKDSIHDAGVYCFMLEESDDEKKNRI